MHSVATQHLHIGGFRLADGTPVNLRLAYTRCGPEDAPAYLILHGYAGSHHALAPHPDAIDGGWAAAWAGPGRALDTDSVQVLTVNLPGSAYGSCWEGAPHTHASVEGMAQAIAALLDGLDLPQLAGAIGYSFGGYVAQQLKASHPERVRRVLGLCTAPRGRGNPDELAFLRGLTDAAARADFRRSVLLRAGAGMASRRPMGTAIRCGRAVAPARRGARLRAGAQPGRHHPALRLFRCPVPATRSSGHP
jgi:homoserine acetyltransferase